MFDERDRACHMALMKLLNEATFPLKAKEVKAFATVYEWVRDLPLREAPKPVKKTKKKKADKSVDRPT